MTTRQDIIRSLESDVLHMAAIKEKDRLKDDVMHQTLRLRRALQTEDEDMATETCDRMVRLISNGGGVITGVNRLGSTGERSTVMFTCDNAKRNYLYVTRLRDAVAALRD